MTSRQLQEVTRPPANLAAIGRAHPSDALLLKNVDSSRDLQASGNGAVKVCPKVHRPQLTTCVERLCRSQSIGQLRANRQEAGVCGVSIQGRPGPPCLAKNGPKMTVAPPHSLPRP